VAKVIKFRARQNNT